MMAAVEITTLLILFVVIGIALRHQWRRAKGLRAQLTAAENALEQLQNTCSRLAPAGVVQRLVADDVQPSAGLLAERKVATAMFVDLVGFSALSERLDPELLLRVINGYYQRMSDAIDEHCGHVGSFLGDGIIAYFGAIQPNAWECDDAVRAALTMRAAMREYNVELQYEGLPAISIGIGIDRGTGIAGLLGSHKRKEYTFIGSAVNLAARIQALTRIHQVDILVSEAVRAALAPEFIVAPMPPEAAKGFAKPIITYAVRGVRPILNPLTGVEERDNVEHT